MKKLFGLLLLCIAVIFFSCKTTGAIAASTQENVVPPPTEETEEDSAIPNEDSVVPSENEESENDSDVAEEENSEEQDENADEQDEDTEEENDYEEEEIEPEKIPQEEIDELNALLAYKEPELVEEDPLKELDQIDEPEAVAEPETIEEAAPQIEETTQSEVLPVPETPSVPETAPAPVDETPVVPQDEESEEIDEALLGKEAPVIIPSRTLTVKRNQYVDIIYPGTGWIYLGEENKTNHFVFQGRKLQKGESIFTLRSKTSGTTILHFYKNDALTGNYIDDYIEITVTEESAFDTKHITAPSYADAVPPKFQPEPEEETQEELPPQKPVEQKAETPKPQPQTPSPKETTNIQQKDAEPEQKETSENVQTVIQTSPLPENEGGRNTSVAAAPSMPQGEGVQTPSTENTMDASAITDSAKTLLEKAQKAYDEKRYTDALKYIEQFFVVATEEFDAGLYLEGRILEAKSEVQNIKRAIEAYDTLLKNWPQSPFWRRANERSIYLKRFYIDIR